MSYPIDPLKIRGVIVECNTVLQQHKFNVGEVLVGLAELIGRIIVENATTDVQAKEMIDVVGNHVVCTVQLGAEATGKSQIARM